MKAISLDQNFDVGNSFSVLHEVRSKFVVPWHKHKEMELMYIIKGGGTRFVGDSIEQFSDGDLVFVGPNVPHFWKSDEEYEFCRTKKIHFYCVVFKESLLKGLLEFPEFKLVKDLFLASKHAVIFRKPRNKEIFDHIKAIEEHKNALRYTHLISALQLLAEEKYEKLISPGYSNEFNSHADERLNKAYDYIHDNFRKDIYLKDLANIANMSVNAFSSFFRRQTNKTFSQFLIEVRVGHACRLIMLNRYTISQIAIESGFKNQSNFNRHFKNVTGKSPMEYKKEHS